MPRLVSEVWLWEEAGRVCALLQSNASEGWMRARLCALGLCEVIEACERRADATRMRGGTHFIVTFRNGVTRDDVRGALERA